LNQRAQQYFYKYWPLLLILLVAAISRLWQLERVPFMHDEFSALFRTRFDSFGELIRIGVVENDSHPAGVQVFLYYWVRLVGFNEFWIKLPFALMGVGSVYLVYRISYQWFNELTALLSAAFIAATQYAIFYSQLARPYAAGQFFVLLLAAQCYLWFHSKVNRKSVFFFGITAVLAALMHAFSLAQAGLIVLTMLLCAPAQNRKALWLAILLAFIIYLPHIPVFWHQLKAGGIGGWLGKPDSDFLFKFLYYGFNYSWYLLAIACSLFCISLLISPKLNVRRPAVRWILLSWFLVPLLVAWLYSVHRTPILQFSTLYFSFPFLVIFFFSFINTENYKPNQYGLLVTLFLMAALGSTIFERQHFKMMQHQGFDQMALEMSDARKKFSDQLALASYNATPEMGAFYQQKQELYDVKHFSKHQTIQDLGDWLQNQDTEFMGFGWTDYAPAEWELISAVYYPRMLDENAWFNAYWRLAARGQPDEPSKNPAEIPLSQNRFFNSQRIYGDAWLPDTSLILNKTQILGVAAFVRHEDTLRDLKLVIELRDRRTDSLLHWQAGTIQNAWRTDTASIWLSALRFSMFAKDAKQYDIRSYLWNKSGEKFEIQKANFYVRNEQPYILGLMEPF
jgi:hypothetical protein